MRIATRILLIWAAIDVVAAYFWYRFMDRINPAPKPSQLEQQIRDFERWQKQ